jgi:hypothetical protein
MNERIRELAAEAKMSTYLLAYGLEFNISIEKFAQSIVRECALICESRPGLGDDVRSRQHCSEQILEHFGAKE